MNEKRVQELLYAWRAGYRAAMSQVHDATTTWHRERAERMFLEMFSRSRYVPETDLDDETRRLVEGALRMER